MKAGVKQRFLVSVKKPGCINLPGTGKIIPGNIDFPGLINSRVEITTRLIR